MTGYIGKSPIAYKFAQGWQEKTKIDKELSPVSSQESEEMGRYEEDRRLPSWGPSTSEAPTLAIQGAKESKQGVCVKIHGCQHLILAQGPKVSFNG